MTTSSIGAFSRVSPPGTTPSPPPSQTLLSRASISFQGLSDSTVLYAESRTQSHLLEETPQGLQALYTSFLDQQKVPETSKSRQQQGPILHPDLAPIRPWLYPACKEHLHPFLTNVAVGLLVAAALVFLISGPIIGPLIGSHLFGLCIYAVIIAEIAHRIAVRLYRDIERSRPPAKPPAHIQASHELAEHARVTLQPPVEGQPRPKPVIRARIAGRPQGSPASFGSSSGSMNASISEESLRG